MKMTAKYKAKGTKNELEEKKLSRARKRKNKRQGRNAHTWKSTASKTHVTYEAAIHQPTHECAVHQHHAKRYPFSTHHRYASRLEPPP